MRSRRRQALEEAQKEDEKPKKSDADSAHQKSKTTSAHSTKKTKSSKNEFSSKTSKSTTKASTTKKKEERKRTGRVHIRAGSSFDYPPEKIEFQITKNEEIAAKTSKLSSSFLTEQWCEGQNAVLIDETKSIKYAAISIFIEKLRTSYESCPSFILLVHSPDIPLWVEQFKYWTTQTMYVATTIKSERLLIKDTKLFYEPAHVQGYGIIITSYDQVQRDSSIIPKRQWASIIADDPPNDIDLNGMISLQKTYIGHENLDENMALDKFLEVPESATVDPSTIFVISAEDAAEDNLFEENFTPCPMSPLQHSMYLETLLEYSKKMQVKKTRTVKTMCELGKKLRLISSHPMLVSDTPMEVVNSSGKTIILQRLISQQKLDGKKCAIFCSESSMPILDSVLTEGKTVHYLIDESESEENAMILINEYNKANDHRIIICAPNFAGMVLDNFNGETVIAFDTDWTPIEEAAKIIMWHARIPKALIYRLITSDSYEFVLFQHFWRHRKFHPSDLDTSERVSDKTISPLIRAAYRIAYKNLDTLHSTSRSIFRDIKSLPYADPTLFPETKEEWNDSFWELTEKHQQIASTKQTKALTASQFWIYPRLTKFLEVFESVGWGKWERFEEFNRPEIEIQKLAALVSKQTIKKADEKSVDCPRLITLVKEASRFDLKRFMTSLAAWNKFSGHLSPDSLLPKLEKYLVMDRILTEGANFFKQFNELIGERAVDDIKELISKVRENNSEELTSEDKEFAEAFVAAVKKATDPAVMPTLSKQKSVQVTGFDAEAHDKVINTLLTYGFTDINMFMVMADLETFQPDSVQAYVDAVIKASNEAEAEPGVKSILVKRIPRYQSVKIPQRIQMFDKIRECTTKYDEYSAEDIEFLKAVASHGMSISQSSPIIKCIFKGFPSEPKIMNKIKALFDEPRRSKVVQRIPKDITQKLPIRINDMMMLMSMGTIDPRFHDENYIYPIGYSINVVIPSITHPNMLAWAECRIDLDNDELVFIINPTPTTEVETYKGKTADEVFEKYRVDLKKAADMHITYYDGNEMFGLTTGFIHRLLLEMKGIETCTNYKRRFFSAVYPINTKWPQIGRYEGDGETTSSSSSQAAASSANAAVPKQNIKKFKFKKKAFGELLPPLVVDCESLVADDSQRYSLDINSVPPPSTVVDAFDSWIDFTKFLN